MERSSGIDARIPEVVGVFGKADARVRVLVSALDKVALLAQVLKPFVHRLWVGLADDAGGFEQDLFGHPATAPAEVGPALAVGVDGGEKADVLPEIGHIAEFVVPVGWIEAHAVVVELIERIGRVRAVAIDEPVVNRIEEAVHVVRVAEIGVLQRLGVRLKGFPCDAGAVVRVVLLDEREEFIDEQRPAAVVGFGDDSLVDDGHTVNSGPHAVSVVGRLATDRYGASHNTRRNECNRGDPHEAMSDYKPLATYGIIGNLETCALVGTVGSAVFFIMLTWYLYAQLPSVFWLVVVIAAVVFTVEAVYFERQSLEEDMEKIEKQL